MNYADELRSLFEDHLYKNLNQYVDSKINASQRRFLLAKWVWEALPKVGFNNTFFQEVWVISRIRWK